MASGYCANCKRASQRKVSSEETRDRNLRSNYGIDIAQFEELLRLQGGGCAICGVSLGAEEVGTVDHCHVDGQVRGILCGGCNRGLGSFADDPRRLRAAAAYLEGNRSPLLPGHVVPRFREKPPNPLDDDDEFERRLALVNEERDRRR